MIDRLEHKIWYLITIDDPDFLPGKNLIDILNLIHKSINIKYVSINDIEGSSSKNWLIYNLKKLQNSMLEIDFLISLIPEVNQFEWGDFFLFEDYQESWNIVKKTSYPEIISHTDTTVRAIDGQYLYIYTPYNDLANQIQEKFNIESIKKDNLLSLEFPY